MEIDKDFKITKADEIIVMRYIVTMLLEYNLINESEKEKILSKYK